jgi:hypothetical protein
MTTKTSLVFSLLAILTWLAVSAIPAFAAPHKWLVAGAQIPAGVNVNVRGELTKPLFVEDSNAFGMGRVEIECSKATAKGTVTANGVGKWNELTFVLGECHVVAGGAICLKLEAFHWVKSPWETQLAELTFKDAFTSAMGNPGFLAECKVGALTIADTCTAPFSLEASNTVTNDVDLKATVETEETKFTCSGGAETGLILTGATLLVSTETGEALAVSA